MSEPSEATMKTYTIMGAIGSLVACVFVFLFEVIKLCFVRRARRRKMKDFLDLG